MHLYIYHIGFYVITHAVILIFYLFIYGQDSIRITNINSIVSIIINRFNLTTDNGIFLLIKIIADFFFFQLVYLILNSFLRSFNQLGFKFIHCHSFGHILSYFHIFSINFPGFIQRNFTQIFLYFHHFTEEICLDGISIFIYYKFQLIFRFQFFIQYIIYRFQYYCLDSLLI